jgi:prostaglandin reductase 3
VEAQLLKKSASVRGFFLNHYLEDAPRHMKSLSEMVLKGEIQSAVDPQLFSGLEDIPRAIDFLYSGQNQGKVVVCLSTAAKM